MAKAEKNIDLSVLDDKEIAEQIRGVLKDVSDLRAKAKFHTDAIKEHYKGLSDSTGLPLRFLRRLGKIHHEQSFHAEAAEADATQEGYIAVFGEPGPVDPENI